MRLHDAYQGQGARLHNRLAGGGNHWPQALGRNAVVEVSGIQHNLALHHLLFSMCTSCHDMGACCQMHAVAGVELALHQLCAAYLSSHSCWAKMSRESWVSALRRTTTQPRAGCQIISGLALTPVPVPVQVYGAMRKLALEQQAETAQLNAAVQQSGDKEDEDPDLDEDEADAKQVTPSWDAQMGQGCPQHVKRSGSFSGKSWV